MKNKLNPTGTPVIGRNSKSYGGQCYYVLRDDRDAFLKFCEDNGHQTKPHVNPFEDAYMVRHQGHWMAIKWNNGLCRYSADRRLGLIVQSFLVTKVNNASN